MTDAEIIECLKQIDESESISCTDWEANVLDEIKKLPKPRVLSPLQRSRAERIIKKYEKRLSSDEEPEEDDT